MKVLLAAGAVPVVFVGLLTSAMFMGNAASSGDTSAVGCTASVDNGGATATLDPEQTQDAKVIIAVGKGMHVPAGGWVVAIATALQESSLHNLDYGDRDSLGIFQQRPSEGWGTPAQVMDPTYAAGAFYDHLLAVPGWAAMPVTEAAQAVQRSAFPDAYATWEPEARAIVTALSGQTPAAACSTIGLDLPAGDVGAMLRVALAQVGKPYVWGATGPDAFDCSGLVLYAWTQAGYTLNARTSEAQWLGSEPITPDAVRPGDLAFSEFAGAGPGHVEIVVAPGMLVEAPHTGDVVKVRSYTDGEGLRFGRLTASVLSKNGDATR